MAHAERLAVLQQPSDQGGEKVVAHSSVLAVLHQASHVLEVNHEEAGVAAGVVAAGWCPAAERDHAMARSAERPSPVRTPHPQMSSPQIGSEQLGSQPVHSSAHSVRTKLYTSLRTTRVPVQQLEPKENCTCNEESRAHRDILSI